MTRSLAILALVGSLYACANALPTASSNSALSPALVSTNNNTLDNEQINDLQNAISALTDNTPAPPLGNRAFTVTNRLTIGPAKLPAGAVTRHLESVFLLKTDGENCFLVNEKTEQSLLLEKLACKPLHK
ncbi:MAG TPA: hypothetical protein VIC26_05505 [Marinagarivorans sp.]